MYVNRKLLFHFFSFPLSFNIKISVNNILNKRTKETKFYYIRRKKVNIYVNHSTSTELADINQTIS